MPNIDIRAHHRLTRPEALQAADALAADLADKFGVDYGWDGDTLVFERPGASGEITIDDSSIHIEAELGMLLALLRGRIEDEVRRYLADHFGCTFKR